MRRCETTGTRLRYALCLIMAAGSGVEQTKKKSGKRKLWKKMKGLHKRKSQKQWNLRHKKQLDNGYLINAFISTSKHENTQKEHKYNLTVWLQHTKYQVSLFTQKKTYYAVHRGSKVINRTICKWWRVIYMNTNKNVNVWYLYIQTINNWIPCFHMLITWIPFSESLPIGSINQAFLNNTVGGTFLSRVFVATHSNRN
jgi:hypothetical protein